MPIPYSDSDIRRENEEASRKAAICDKHGWVDPAQVFRALAASYAAEAKERGIELNP